MTDHLQAVFDALDAADADPVPTLKALRTLDAHDLGQLLAHLDRSVESLRRWRAEVDKVLVPQLPHEGITVEEVGHLEVSTPGRWAYDQPRLIKAWAARISDEVAVDRETGERLPPAVVVERALEVFAKACGITPGYTNWRKGVAEEHGLNLKPFRQWQPSDGPPKVVIK